VFGIDDTDEEVEIAESCEQEVQIDWDPDDDPM
jgi:hypothetical protein